MGGAAQKIRQTEVSDDLAPAIRYAEEGFPVTELIAYYWSFGPRLYKGSARRISRNLHA